MAPLTLGFLMDPLESVRVDHDSTFTMMMEAQRRGHTVRYFEQGWLRFNGTCAEARMRTVTLRREAGRHFELKEESVRPLSSLDVLFLRKDPPVDVEFLHATQLVELCAGKAPVFINSPAGLREANEKLFALHFPELMPETCVAREHAVLTDFIARHPEGTILKPIDGFGGKGIVFVEAWGPEHAIAPGAADAEWARGDHRSGVRAAEPRGGQADHPGERGAEGSGAEGALRG